MSAQHILISLLCLTLGACAFSKDEAEKKKVLVNQGAQEDVLETIEQQAFSGQLSDENVRVEFEENDAPGVYDLVISWPKAIPSMKVAVGDMPYTIISKASNYKATATNDQTYQIHLVAQNSLGGDISSYTKIVRAPKDIVIKKRHDLTEGTKIKVNRLYFYDGGLIQTNGFNLEITANKIYTTTPLNDGKMSGFFDAHILTNPPTQVAQTEKQHNGSIISIDAEKAYGRLRIALIGMNGQNGEAGKDAVADAALNGANGTDGVTKLLVESCVGADGMPCRQKPNLQCTSNPTDGSNGKKGYTGGRGGDGWNGGNSGQTAIFIQDSSEFLLEVMQRRGQPGKGGPGGKGSAGGLGGSAGANPQGKCRAAKNGANGPAGDDGPRGQDGQPGLLKEVVNNTPNAVIYEER